MSKKDKRKMGGVPDRKETWKRNEKEGKRT